MRAIFDMTNICRKMLEKNSYSILIRFKNKDEWDEMIGWRSKEYSTEKDRP